MYRCSVFRQCFVQNLRKSKQISFKAAMISTKFEKHCKLFSISNVENAKKKDEMLLKYSGLSGAKACKYCRSRQELSHKYLAFVCKIRLRYSRDELLHVFRWVYVIIYSFASWIEPQPLARARCTDGAFTKKKKIQIMQPKVFPL